jgi:hypothetical protein
MCLPNVWILNARFITTAERNCALKYFDQNPYTTICAKHKLQQSLYFTRSASVNWEIPSDSIWTENARNWLDKESRNIDCESRNDYWKLLKIIKSMENSMPCRLFDNEKGLEWLLVPEYQQLPVAWTFPTMLVLLLLFTSLFENMPNVLLNHVMMRCCPVNIDSSMFTWSFADRLSVCGLLWARMQIEIHSISIQLKSVYKQLDSILDYIGLKIENLVESQYTVGEYSNCTRLNAKLFKEVEMGIVLSRVVELICLFSSCSMFHLNVAEIIALTQQGLQLVDKEPVKIQSSENENMTVEARVCELKVKILAIVYQKLKHLDLFLKIIRIK